MMPFARKRSSLILAESERNYLKKLSVSRREAISRVRRARILLLYYEGKAINAISNEIGTSRPSVERCIDKALAGGVSTALSDLRRKGRPASITAEDKVWVIDLACRRPADFGYSYQVWTISLLKKHVRENCISEGHPSLSRAGKSLIHKILGEVSLKPHKMKYYLERRDPEFDAKMAQVLLVYKEVQMVNESKEVNDEGWSVVCYDEKPGIQAIENTTPDLPPVPGKHPCSARDNEYRRHGTLSILAGIDLHDGKVIGLVKDKHRSREFIEFLETLKENYPTGWKLRIILDNHSIHISKETVRWLKKYPNKFEFIFTPKHGSWLNLIEVFFSKMTRTFLRFLRVKSKDELKKRIDKYFDEVNKTPVVFRWKYKMDEVFI